MRDLLNNLQRGLKLALFQSVPPQRWQISMGALLALLALVGATAIGLDWIHAESHPVQFQALALRQVFWDLPLLLLVGWCASRSLPLYAPVALLALGWVCQVLGYGVLALVAGLAAPQQVAVWSAYVTLAVVVWQLAATFFFFRRSMLRGWLAAVALSVPIAFLVQWSLDEPSARFWAPAPEESRVALNDSPADEEILGLQASLINEHLDALEPHRPGVTDLYFVGFGSYGSQAVFARELAVIHPLMDQRFDTANRSVRLVNHASTLRDYPMATVTHLRKTLASIAQRMDPDEDVLMLYLTSHGSRQHWLAVEFAPLQLFDLDGATLKRMLDEAGIRHRVIVISACYSGGFISSLADDHTLVLTASDAQRTSFGCSDDSKFTYFGRALFDEELRRTYSFVDAFKASIPVIREREREYDSSAEFSNPQMSMGRSIEPRLKALEQRLGGR